MSAYVTGPGFPLVLEFEGDDARDVASRVREIMNTNNVVTLHLGDAKDASTQVLIHFRNITLLLVSAEDPELDPATGEIDPADEPKIRYKTSLSKVETR